MYLPPFAIYLAFWFLYDKMEIPMSKNISVKTSWVNAFETVVKRPIVMMPFFIIAFFEGLALELIYFSTRKPLSVIAVPIIKKFSAEVFTHYPYYLAKVPKIFYYSQVLIYVFAGVFLSAISVNMLKNIKAGLPLKSNALIRNALDRYLSFIAFGAIMAAIIFLLERTGSFAYMQLVKMPLKIFPNMAPKIHGFLFTCFMFLLDMIVQTFLVLTVPIIVIEKAPLWKAILRSMKLGLFNFFKILPLIALPLILYFPVMVLKSFSTDLAGKTFPEVVLFIAAAGIIASAFVECFIVTCASQFLLEINRSAQKI